ncbi:MAG TPA: hypothetical protein VHB77_06835 [Planctomycetaceae bacterium]|nr:hypothetical protein [Planctomycetaceae bacterium]
MARMKDLLIKVQDRAWHKLNHAERAYLRSIGQPAPGDCRCAGCRAKRAEGIKDTFAAPCTCDDCTTYQEQLRRDVHASKAPNETAEALNASF